MALTNRSGSNRAPFFLGGRTAARVNAERMPGARYTKSFNTLTAAFQAAVANRAEPERVVQWIAGDDADAKSVTASLVSDAGYVPVDLAGIDGCTVMEAPAARGRCTAKSTVPLTPTRS